MRYISFGTIEADIDDATQFATVYTYGVVNGLPNGYPIATLQRARVLDKGYSWKLYNALGECIYTWKYSPPYESLVDATARQLSKDGWRKSN
jgi:hypothetical protein